MSGDNMRKMQQLALQLDQMPFERLSSALRALAIYEEETDRWIADWQAEAEDRGDDFDEDDAYGTAYDAFCNILRRGVLKMCGALVKDMYLAMDVLCDDWVQVTTFMQDNAKRELVVETMCRI